jgi:hypothetical protein
MKWSSFTTQSFAGLLFVLESVQAYQARNRWTGVYGIIWPIPLTVERGG